LEKILYDENGKVFKVSDFEKLNHGGFIVETEDKPKVPKSKPANPEDVNLVFEGMFNDEDGIYWFIDSFGIIQNLWTNHERGVAFRKRLKIGNAFPTKEIAEKTKELRFGLNGQIMTRVLWENEKSGYSSDNKRYGESKFLYYNTEEKEYQSANIGDTIPGGMVGSPKSISKVADILNKTK